MEHPRRSYSICSRPTKRQNRPIFYAVFRDETGAYDTAVSTTGSPRLHLPETAVPTVRPCLTLE